MLFQVTAEDHIGIVDEHGWADVSAGENTFASEQGRAEVSP
jgi:hypothetical protein